MAGYSRNTRCAPIGASTPLCSLPAMARWGTLEFLLRRHYVPKV
jgi:hypothetical protein